MDIIYHFLSPLLHMCILMFISKERRNHLKTPFLFLHPMNPSSPRNDLTSHPDGNAAEVYAISNLNSWAYHNGSMKSQQLPETADIAKGGKALPTPPVCVTEQKARGHCKNLSLSTNVPLLAFICSGSKTTLHLIQLDKFPTCTAHNSIC